MPFPSEQIITEDGFDEHSLANFNKPGDHEELRYAAQKKLPRSELVRKI